MPGERFAEAIAQNGPALQCLHSKQAVRWVSFLPGFLDSWLFRELRLARARLPHGLNGGGAAEVDHLDVRHVACEVATQLLIF